MIDMESVDLQPTVQQEELALGPMRIFCKQNPSLNMAVRGVEVVLVNANPEDESQHWFQLYNVGKLTDDMGRRAFVLLNTSRGQAMVDMYNDLVLEPHNIDQSVMTPMLWSQGRQLEGGFTEIRTFWNPSKTLNALGGNAVDGTVVGIWHAEPWQSNAVWKIEPIIRINSVV